MNGVFQAVTVIDTIIFWKVKDLLMWQTTVWEILNLHNSHCFQLNAWHDRLPAWEEEEVKRTAATSAGGSSVSPPSTHFLQRDRRNEGENASGWISKAGSAGWEAGTPPITVLQLWSCSAAWRGLADSLEGLLQPPSLHWHYPTSNRQCDSRFIPVFTE